MLASHGCWHGESGAYNEQCNNDTESALRLGFDALKSKQLEQFLLSFQAGILLFCCLLAMASQ